MCGALVSINSIDMRFCYPMLLLLLQHQQTGCSVQCTANHVDQALQPAVLFLFLQPPQTALSAAVSMLLPAYYDVFNTRVLFSLRKEAVYSGVCICTLYSSSPCFHLGPN